jgi:hypothetical protein
VSLTDAERGVGMSFETVRLGKRRVDRQRAFMQLTGVGST